MKILVAALAFLPAAPVLAAEQLACEAPFAIDATEQSLAEAFGRANVVTREADGPEGTTLIATFIHPDDPARMQQILWWDEEELKEPSSISVPPGDISPGGLAVGMSIEEVEAIVGHPFMMLGFGWDYGGSFGIQGGTIPGLPEGCFLSIQFEPTAALPEGTDEGPINGDIEVPSALPLLRQVKPVIEGLTFGYAHPDFG